MTVEGGALDKGQWVTKRRWNSEYSDHGFNLTKPTVLKVQFGTFH